ncbi:MAG: methionyl-tRNA formyltransferase [Candidatus Caenarcaniphilales bacterium]|nr:methionyl-tRNA formyltransferase [Candidatus Caenarcaniphilales bacterium]
MDLVFLGTPSFAEPALKKLLESDHRVVAVVTQPDKPVGRGQKITPPPVKVLAEKYHVPVYQPTNLKKDPSLLESLQELSPDLMITAAYGQILNQKVLDIPKIGVWNIHASLLPRWRGAAPINWAILSGDPVTGITIMQTELGLDTGAILSKAELQINPDTNAPNLTHQLAKLGADLLLQTIGDFISGKIVPVSQDDSLATHAPKLVREMGLVDFGAERAITIDRKIRALLPWPSAYFHDQDQIIKIFQAEPKDSQARDRESGSYIGLEGEGVLVQCNPGILKLITVQPPNKAKMKAAEWYRNSIMRT